MGGPGSAEFNVQKITVVGNVHVGDLKKSGAKIIKTRLKDGKTRKGQT